jgi:DNA-damage-inducible protein D
MLKSEEIKALFALFGSASAKIEGLECWSARELQKLLGYMPIFCRQLI